MKIRVFYKSAPSENLPLVRNSLEDFDDVNKKLGNLEKKLKETQNKIEQEKIQGQIILLKRNRARLEKFSNLQEGKPELKKSTEIQTILAGKNTENYLGSDLHILRKRGVDIASLALVKESNPAEAANSSSMKKDDRFIVNFGGNESLKKKVGAGDILPPEVTKVKINGVECERRNSPRPGYYKIEEGKRPIYQPIYDGYKIEIVERRTSITPEEIKATEIAAENRWKKVRMSEMRTTLQAGKSPSDLDEDKFLLTEFQEKEKQKIERRKIYASYNPENKEKFLETF